MLEFILIFLFLATGIAAVVACVRVYRSKRNQPAAAGRLDLSGFPALAGQISCQDSQPPANLPYFDNQQQLATASIDLRKRNRRANMWMHARHIAFIKKHKLKPFEIDQQTKRILYESRALSAKLNSAINRQNRPQTMGKLSIKCKVFLAYRKKCL